MDRVGIFGGTFNPPHLGHSAMTEAALKSCRLDRLVFLPTGTVPHKDNFEIIDAKHRLKMVSFLAEKNSKFSVCDYEATQNKTCYTADTLKMLSRIYKGAELYFILGADSLDYIEKWYKPEEIFRLATICVMPRKEISDVRIKEQISRLKSDYNAKIMTVDMPVVEISSTEIRKKLRDGEDISSFVEPMVYEYIKKYGLYL